MGMFVAAICINVVPLLFSPCDGGFLREQQDRESCSKAPGRALGCSGWDHSLCLFPASMEKNLRC